MINETGLQITNEQGQAADGSNIIQTTFISTNPELYDPNITQNLTQVVDVYDDVNIPTSQNAILLNEIKLYASRINCTDFHGKGTIDDYATLFQAASQIANDSKQIQLDVNVEGFDEFSAAADELSQLFTNFTLRLQNVNIINDLNFLTSIANALKKIWNLSEVFGRFKETILTTTTIQIPKSAHETKVVIEGVMEEIDCAMRYISNFVSPTDPLLPDAELSPEEKNIIQKAVTTIESWNAICEQGVSTTLSSNPDIQFIKNASNSLKQTTNTLKNATQSLRNKLNTYMNL